MTENKRFSIQKKPFDGLCIIDYTKEGYYTYDEQDLNKLCKDLNKLHEDNEQLKHENEQLKEEFYDLLQDYVIKRYNVLSEEEELKFRVNLESINNMFK